MEQVRLENRRFLASTSAQQLALIAAAACAVGLMAWMRLHLLSDRMIPIGYGVPLCLFLLTNNRTLLWITAAAFAVISYLKIFYVLPAHDPHNLWRGKEWFALTLDIFDLVAIAAIVHLLIGARMRRERALAQLSDANAELAAREEEIARQNEELQSQTEELERQTEELRVTNEELMRREKMLEALLSLSRNLTVEISGKETMDKVCQSLAELVNGENVATAIVEKRGDMLHVLCHNGFGPDGITRTEWPLKSSFAAMVLERNRTGYLENLDLRPDLVIPQPKRGAQMKSVLAAPLRVRGRSVGALEVFHTEPHAWAEEQINIIESLAAQASVSLEAAELFEQVERDRKRLETILQTIPIGVSICNEGCEQVTYNPAGAMLLGVTPNTPLIAANVQSRWQTFRAGKQVGREESPLYRAATRGQEVLTEERELVFPNGRRITVLSSASPLLDKDGKIVGAVGAFADITQLKQLQLELDARRRQAEEDSVRKTRFLAAVSHDIRTPANAIGLLAELLSRGGDSPSMIEEIPQIAADMKTSANSLVSLVSDVLDLTRFDVGRVELIETEFALSELIQEEARQYSHVAKEKGLQFNCDPPPRDLRIRTDRVKLARVLNNLISNAIKFTESGRVSCEVSRPPDGGVQIRVIDTGPGIAPEHQEKIFDEYFQLKNPRGDRQTGSGLGLAISRRLVEAMGGKISVSSGNPGGSTFMVKLPASCVVAG